jgi:hypothetical protein
MQFEKTFTKFGTVHDNTQIYSSVHHDDALSKKVSFNVMNSERDVIFYHPASESSSNDLANILNATSEKYYELALSFDKTYPFSFIVENLPNDNLDWVWINHDKQKGSISHLEAFGFHFNKNDPANGTKEFLNTLKDYDNSKNGFSKDAQKLYRELKKKNQLKENYLPVNGVIVSGTPKELKRYLDLPFVKASSLGATVDVY